MEPRHPLRTHVARLLSWRGAHSSWITPPITWGSSWPYGVCWANGPRRDIRVKAPASLNRGNLLFLVAALAGALGCASNSRGVTAAADQTSVPRATSCAGNLAIDATVYDTTQVTERPVLRSSPQIRYPDVALRHHIAGRVVVAAVVSTIGVIDVENVRLVNSVHPVLDAEALAFVNGSSYWPGCLNGKAVRVRLTIPIDFKILR